MKGNIPFAAHSL